MINDDVRRTDRLISIFPTRAASTPNCSGRMSPRWTCDGLLTTLVTVANETKRDNQVSVEVKFEGAPFDTFLDAGP
ncbi:MAG: hypothetical protein R3D69_09715 [Xanthobacteraceae bacterium]